MLSFHNIKKSYSSIEVLHGISFDIDAGKVTALIGENGAGKSTLMKITSGVITDYEGHFSLEGSEINVKNPREAENIGISIIHQELNLIPDLSVAENIFLGREPMKSFGFIDFKQLYKDADEVLKTFDFPYTSKILAKNISVSWQQIVEIARVFSIESKVVIMDEPTSALTDSEVSILFDKIRLMREKGKSIIYISHKMDEIDEIADDIVVLRDGLFIAKHQTKDISREKLVSEMIGKQYYETEKRNKKTFGDSILSLKNISLHQNNKSILDNLSFSIDKGEVVGLAGLMGSGKSDLMKFLFGDINTNYDGALLYKDNKYIPKHPDDAIKRGIFYLSNDRKTEGIFANQSLVFNSTISVLQRYSNLLLDETEEKKDAESYMNQLSVKKDKSSQPINTLSGGNQQKILLGRGLMIKPSLMLLDEPTRGIDIGAKEDIYNLMGNLSDNGMSILVSSSEIPELLRVCDRIVVMSAGKVMGILETKKTDAEEVLSLALGKEIDSSN